MADLVEGKKVMVAVDESEASYYALIWVLENLKEVLVNTSLVIFAAVPEPNYTQSIAATFSSARLYSMAATAPELAISVQEQQKKVVLGLLEKAKSICTGRGVKAETVMETGDAKLAICAAVEKYNISMLILGDSGFGRIHRALVWSVGSYCVQYAKCSVLVVKRP
ncbi:hypothetical protein QQ045_020151 [Rhodiola kirilowii]